MAQIAIEQHSRVPSHSAPSLIRSISSPNISTVTPFSMENTETRSKETHKSEPALIPSSVPVANASQTSVETQATSSSEPFEFNSVNLNSIATESTHQSAPTPPTVVRITVKPNRTRAFLLRNLVRNSATSSSEFLKSFDDSLYELKRTFQQVHPQCSSPSSYSGMTNAFEQPTQRAQIEHQIQWPRRFAAISDVG